MLRRWHGEQKESPSVIFARNGSGVAGLPDLIGKTIAFESPRGSQGYLVPKLALAQKGGIVRARMNPDQPVPDGEIGYVFTGDNENTMVWVLRGKVVAGAMDAESFRLHAKARKMELQIVHESAPLPFEIVSLRPGLPITLATRIRDLLTKGGGRIDGKFDDLPEEAVRALANARSFVRAEFGLE